MRKVTCMCETVFEADLPDEINLDAEPGRIDEIIAGDFFALNCPRCGRRLKPEIRVRFLSKKRGLDVTVIPGIERLAFYLGEVEPAKGGEILIGYDELFERALMLRDGLDAAAVEILKYFLRAKAEGEVPASAELSVSYAGLGEDGKLRFHIRGLREDEVAVLPIGMDHYRRVLDEKAETGSREPFVKIFSGPYKSIRALEATEDEEA